MHTSCPSASVWQAQNGPVRGGPTARSFGQLDACRLASHVHAMAQLPLASATVPAGQLTPRSPGPSFWPSPPPSFFPSPPPSVALALALLTAVLAVITLLPLLRPILHLIQRRLGSGRLAPKTPQGTEQRQSADQTQQAPPRLGRPHLARKRIEAIGVHDRLLLLKHAGDTAVTVARPDGPGARVTPPPPPCATGSGRSIRTCTHIADAASTHSRRHDRCGTVPCGRQSSFETGSLRPRWRPTLFLSGLFPRSDPWVVSERTRILPSG